MAFINRADVACFTGFLLLIDQLVDFGLQVGIAGGELRGDVACSSASCTLVTPKMVYWRGW